MRYSVYSATRKGAFHEKNEDSFFIGSNFVIVADGMGGERDGDMASQIAVRSITQSLEKVQIATLGESEVRRLMFDAIANADAEISRYINDHPDALGMGTTVLLLMHDEDKVFLAWCGDSRCYLYSLQTLHALTKDHSYVQELIDSHRLTDEDAFSHPDNNLITRYVGGGTDTCHPDFLAYTMLESDLLILCSDGLSGYCRSEAVETSIAANQDLKHLPEELITLALKCGSADDITIIAMTRTFGSSVSRISSAVGWLKRLLVRKA